MACKHFDCGYPAGDCSGACASSNAAGPAECLSRQPGAAMAPIDSDSSDAEHMGWMAVLFVIVLLLIVLLVSGAADGWLIWLAQP